MDAHGGARTGANTARTNADDQRLQWELCNRIVSAFYRSYDGLGYGYLESVYRNVLAKELTRLGIPFEREVTVDVRYDGETVGHFRADFVIDASVVLEVKASQALGEADRKQLLNYLRCSDLEVGLLLHYGPRPSFQKVVYSNRFKALPP